MHGDTVYLAGRVGTSGIGTSETSAEAQTAEVLARLEAPLERADSRRLLTAMI